MATLPRQYQAHLTEKLQLTPSVFHLIFQATEALHYQPGQYASLLIGNHRRPMSFAAPPRGSRGEFLIDVSPNGVASQWAKSVHVGETLEFLSPYGQFTVNRESEIPRVFIATGTGIAPIRSRLLAEPLQLPTHLIFGSQASTLRFFDHEFVALSQKIPHFTFLPTSQIPDPHWTGAVGHVGNLALKHVPHITESIVYICGGQPMVREVGEMLITRGVPKANIRTEQFCMLH